MEDLLSDSELVNAYVGCDHTICRGGAQCCKGGPGTCSEQTYGSSLACAARAVFRDLAQRQAGDGPAEWCDAGENAGASQTAATACEGMLSAHIPWMRGVVKAHKDLRQPCSKHAEYICMSSVR